MQENDRVFKGLFNNLDSLLIVDKNGKILYYEDYNDEINVVRFENAVGRSVFELYPFFRRKDFTLFKAIDTGRIIVNQLQYFEINGVQHKALNSAYPLINETGVIGCMVMSTELRNSSGTKISRPGTSKYNFNDIVTQNQTFLKSFDKLRRLAASESTILVFGETGTGKELISHTIHANSPRRNKPFIIQNCAAIPENLMETTLFGSVKGSYTGATDRPGLFEVADGGTLFLDEINSIPYNMQGKLLRVLETNTVRRVGDTDDRQIDVRIIASTNEDIAMLVNNGRFRKDLWFRLNVASFYVPSLRERTEDIPLLCRHYIEYFNAIRNHRISGIEKSLMNFFMQYPWEGNIRELRNVIDYACNIKSCGEITYDDVPDYMIHRSACMEGEEISGNQSMQVSTGYQQVQPGRSLTDQLNAFEKEIILNAYERNRYSITKTAKELKISRQTLYNKLKKYSVT